MSFKGGALKKAFLCYLPIGRYQRGEDRCQADIDGSTTQAPHAPNDLGYIAAQLEKFSIESFIRDYPAQRLSEEHLIEDVKAFEPDIFFISTTFPTFEKDALFLKKIKSLKPDILTIAKGSCFFSLPLKDLKNENYASLDIAVYGESEFIIVDIIESLRAGTPLTNVSGLLLHIGSSEVIRTHQPAFEENLDLLPFPKRGLIKNELYTCPNTGKPMATIVVSRGCPLSCIFCLTPIISGQKLRKRSVQNVLEEVKECVHHHEIRDFFMRADTFTMDRGYVKEFCRQILDQGLSISWVANSTTTAALDREMLGLMKAAGCWLIAFGIESGNEEIQKRIKPGIPVENSFKAIRLCREAGIKTFGFFMIGLPHDSKSTLNDTFHLMKELDCDFIEVHIALPYDGTPLNRLSKELGLLKESVLGHNYFSIPYTSGTLHLTRKEVIQFRKKMLAYHYLRPNYIYRTLKSCRSTGEALNYLKYGARLLHNLFVR